MSESGVITSIDTDRQGDDLAADAGSSDTVLEVFNAVDFSEDAATVERWLVIGNETTARRYVDVNKEANTVTLADPVGDDLEAGLPVTLWDPTVPDGGAPAVEYLCDVQLDDDRGSVGCVLPHELVPTSDVYGLVGATVSIDQDDDDDDGDWYVRQVLGRQAVLNADFVVPGDDGAPSWLPDGNPPATASTLALIGGLGSIAARWTEVPNNDPVLYRLHMAADADPATDGSDEVASGWGLTAHLARALPDGTPVIADGSVTYHFIVTVEDADGPGPASTVQTAVPAQVTGPDIAAEVVTTDFLMANDAFIGALQSIDFSAVTITGPRIQTEASEERGIKLAYDPDGGAYLRAWTSDGTKFFDVTPNAGVAIVNGEATLNELTTKYSASLGGTTTVKPSGTVTLLRGAAAPSNKPVVGSTYDQVQFDDDGLWGNRRGIGFDGTHYYIGRQTSSSVLVEKWDTSGSKVAQGALVPGADPSLAYGGGKVWLHVEVPVGSRRDLYMRRIDPSDLSVEATHLHGNTLNASGSGVMAVGYDPTPGATDPLVTAIAGSGAVLFRRRTFTGGTVVDGADVVGSMAVSNLASVLYAQDVSGDGAFDFTAGGPGRFVVANHGGPKSFVFHGSTGATRASEEWDLGIGDKVGIVWNGTAFQSMDRDGVLRTYTAIDAATAQTDASTTKWVSASYFRDDTTDYETNQSTKAKVVQFPKRSKLTIAGPPLDASPGSNDPNAVQFYIGSGSSEPSTANMWRQTSPSAGVTTATYSTITTSGSAHPNAGTPFPSAVPAELNSEALATDGDPVAQVTADGDARFLKTMQGAEWVTGTFSGVGSGFEKSQAYTFDPPFEVTPVIVMGTNSQVAVTRWSSLSTTGVTINAFRTSSTGSINVHWAAILPTQ